MPTRNRSNYRLLGTVNMKSHRIGKVVRAAVVVALIQLLNQISVQASSVHCSPIHSFQRFLQNGEETSEIAGVGSRYNSSAKWVFQTNNGNNLTLLLDEDHFHLGGKDCVKHGGPIVKIVVYPGAKERAACMNRKGDLIGRPIISSNRVELLHCNGFPGGSFKFTVSAKYAGFLPVTQKAQTVTTETRNYSQWIALQSKTNKRILIQLKSITVGVSSAGKCKKGFITVKDSSGRSQLPDNLEIICNKYGQPYLRELEIIINIPQVNISFKKATFRMSYQYLPSSEHSFPATNSTPSKGNVGRNYPNANDVDDANEDEQSPHPYAFIGVGLAGLIVLIVIIIAAAKISRRRTGQNRRQFTKPMTRVEESTYNGETPQVQARGEEMRSINNMMYEKVLKGSVGTNSTINSNGDRISANSSSILNVVALGDSKFPRTGQLQLQKTDKKQQRLGQLSDKYIDVKFQHVGSSSGMIHIDDDTHVMQRPLHTPEHQYPMNEVVSPNFHNDRPPIPPPQRDNGEPYRYESINALTEVDQVPPAYATVVDHKSPSSKTKFQFATPNVGLDVGQYVSSGSWNKPEESICQQSSRRSNSKYTPKSMVTTTNIKIPNVGHDGYLSFTSSENPQQCGSIAVESEEMYISPNRTSNEELERHFKRPTPRPGVNSFTYSMPDLVSDAPKEDEPKPAHRRKITKKTQRSNPSNANVDVPNVTSANDLRHVTRYRQPRPSAPDIFIECAYSSGEDISQIRKHLQRQAAHATGKRENDPRLPLCRGMSNSVESQSCDVPFLYDSPRPSIDGSGDSHLDAPHSTYYDTPRPSLPIIFSDEIQNLIDKSNFQEK